MSHKEEAQELQQKQGECSPCLLGAPSLHKVAVRFSSPGGAIRGGKVENQVKEMEGLPRKLRQSPSKSHQNSRLKSVWFNL